MKCDRCEQPAVLHLTVVENGVVKEKHLCTECGNRHELPSVESSTMSELLSTAETIKKYLKETAARESLQTGSTAAAKNRSVYTVPWSATEFEARRAPLSRKRNLRLAATVLIFTGVGMMLQRFVELAHSAVIATLMAFSFLVVGVLVIPLFMAPPVGLNSPAKKRA